MGVDKAIEAHYGHPGLEESILSGQAALGRDLDHINPEDIAPVDGIDLTPEFVSTATSLTRRSGLSGLVTFTLGSTVDTSFLVSPETYTALLTAAGFAIDKQENRLQYALDFTASTVSRDPAACPPPVQFQLVLGPTIGARMKNISAAMTQGILAPVEILKPPHRCDNHENSPRVKWPLPA